MKSRKVITNTKWRSPIVMGAVIYLFLDKFAAAGWVYGVVGTLWLGLFIVWIVDAFNQEDIDIFKDPKDDAKKILKSWADRIKEKHS